MLMHNPPNPCEILRVECKSELRQAGNTLTVWFDDPRDEYVREETGDEVALMKNREGQVIGFEKLNYSPGISGKGL